MSGLDCILQHYLSQNAQLLASNIFDFLVETREFVVQQEQSDTGLVSCVANEVLDCLSDTFFLVPWVKSNKIRFFDLYA